MMEHIKLLVETLAAALAAISLGLAIAWLVITLV